MKTIKKILLVLLLASTLVASSPTNISATDTHSGSSTGETGEPKIIEPITSKQDNE